MSEPHQVRFWKIEEAVGSIYYIVLPGTYPNKQIAEGAFPIGAICQAVEYKRGAGNQGAERVS